MTREEARKAAEVMLAYANGEKIEQYDNYGGKWSEVKRSCCDFNWLKNAYRIKPKEKFDPKTLKPFDKVLIRDSKYEDWRCDIFSHIHIGGDYHFKTITAYYAYCIPYNDDTKYLVGTKHEAPEYYRYWED